MAHYLVKAKFHKDLLAELRSRLDSGEIKQMRPFGQALQYSLENARLDYAHFVGANLNYASLKGASLSQPSSLRSSPCST